MYSAFAIILVFLHVGNAHISASKTYRFPNKRLILAEPSFDNETLYYATCDQPLKECTVVREINTFTTKAETKKCDINLTADNVQLIVAFGKDKAILVTEKSSILRTTTVHMSNCRTVDVQLFEIPSDWKDVPLYLKFLDVVVFDGGFELVVKELSRICSKPNEDVYCGFSFDNEGKRMEGPYLWPELGYHDIHVDSHIITDASGKGYFFVNKLESSLIGIRADRVGGSAYIKLWGPQLISSVLSIGGQSAANNLDGACYTLNSTVKCWQNDAWGSLKMKTEFTFQHENEIRNVHVHNLRGGGFVLLIIICPDRVCSGTDYHYYLIKINAQGNTVNQLEIGLKKSECNANNRIVLATTYVDKDEMYCSARLCNSHSEEEAKLEILSDCYSDNDFLKENLLD